MKCGWRFVLCFLLLLTVCFVALKRHLQDIYDQYSAGAYLAELLRQHGSDYTAPVPNHGSEGDKVIVMAKLEEEHTEWVEQELPDWQRAIYTVNPSRFSEDKHVLTTPMNKGHESMAYLTYVIDNYDHLPSTIAFLHSHRSGFFLAWHVDAPLHDNVAAMRSLQLDFVQRNGYVNLRCNWNPGCVKAHRKNAHVTEQVFREIFEGTSTPPRNTTISTPEDNPTIAAASRTKQKFLEIPDRVGAACCAQFAVSRDQIRQRPVEDYIKIRQWIMDTDKTDAASGRVMEFLWHVIFGKEAVYCPDAEVCYCQVYGQC
ncbi:hypothetical protein Plec18167_004301 [Paecilomyces lecythidis]|uniref:Uncharacterized protein n=1 Tax=Paecilomyces lecythidis TaxID=3004212 RepID=A0ABR3XSQ8_9EURO